MGYVSKPAVKPAPKVLPRAKYVAVSYELDSQDVPLRAASFASLDQIGSWSASYENIVTTELADRPYVSTFVEHFEPVRVIFADHEYKVGHLSRNWRQKRWVLVTPANALVEIDMADVESIEFKLPEDIPAGLGDVVLEWTDARALVRQTFADIVEMITKGANINSIVERIADYNAREAELFKINERGTKLIPPTKRIRP
jgi:hypothetical protein